jgi:hypothetical protein
MKFNFEKFFKKFDFFYFDSFFDIFRYFSIFLSIYRRQGDSIDSRGKAIVSIYRNIENFTIVNIPRNNRDRTVILP